MGDHGHQLHRDRPRAEPRLDDCLDCDHAMLRHDRLGHCTVQQKVPVDVESPLYMTSKQIAPESPTRYRVDTCDCPGLRL